MQVDPAASKHELLKSKTEIRLKKGSAIKWPTLEKSNEKADSYGKAPTAAADPPPVQQPKPAYPSSFNRRVVDWYAPALLLRSVKAGPHALTGCSPMCWGLFLTCAKQIKC